ncbi:MAG: AIR synthase related protein, partial [Candidatus Paceibacterota bacterium]
MSQSVLAYERFLIVGSGGREHAIAKSLRVTSEAPNLYIACVGTHYNPGLLGVCDNFQLCKDLSASSIEYIVKYAIEHQIEVVVVGPEGPLEEDIADKLAEVGIPCIGPFGNLAAIETYKVFTRRLLDDNPVLMKYNPKYYHYNPNDPNDFEPSVLTKILESFQNGYVIKAVGLKGGKGVKVSGDHFTTFGEAYNFCQELADSDGEFLIEEKLVGQEFSLMSLCDGTSNMVHLPIVQDFKRAYNNDLGPNTGGMGAIMRIPGGFNHSFMEDAQDVNRLVLVDLMKKSVQKQKYIGVLYGSFMITQRGELKVIEYNARFGDPEVINLLHTLQTDLSLVFTAMVSGRLGIIPPLVFKEEYVVSRYLCPVAYPGVSDQLAPNDMILYIDKSIPWETIIYSHVVEDTINIGIDMDMSHSHMRMLGSRAIAIVTSSCDPVEATLMNDAIISKYVGGSFRYRTDIGPQLQPTFIPGVPPKPTQGVIIGSHRQNVKTDQVITYKSAGVNIEEGNRAVDLIKSSVQLTQNELIPKNQYGAFAGLFNIGQCLNSYSSSGSLYGMQLVSSMDGVGTKVQTVVNLLSSSDVAFYNLGQDLFANNINDILCVGRDVKPLFFLDYYGTNKLNADHLAKFVEGLSKSCRESSCVLLGGETAELPDFSTAWQKLKGMNNRNQLDSGVVNQPESGVVDTTVGKASNWEMVGVIVGLIHSH